MRRRGRAVLALTAFFVAASSDVPGAAGQARAAEDGRHGVESADNPVTLAFVGDILLAAAVGGMIEARGVDYPWLDAAPLLEAADLAVGNLEMAIAEGGTAVEKNWTFRGAPELLAGVRRAGIDVVSLANNHTLDFGPGALLETIRNVERHGLVGVGAGRDREAAYAPQIVDVDGVRIGFLAFSRVFPRARWAAGESRAGLASGYAAPPVLRAIDSLATRVDAVVVLVHWGTELQDTPRSKDMKLAERMLEHGATAVIGHHPHVMQGLRWTEDGRLVAYSLGNFVFGSFRPKTRETGILYLDIGADKGVVGARLEPMYIRVGRPRTVEPRQRAKIARRISALSVPFGTFILPTGELRRAHELPLLPRPRVHVP